jgi:hypothetical protein
MPNEGTGVFSPNVLKEGAGAVAVLPKALPKGAGAEEVPNEKSGACAGAVLEPNETPAGVDSMEPNPLGAAAEEPNPLGAAAIVEVDPNNGAELPNVCDAAGAEVEPNIEPAIDDESCDCADAVLDAKIGAEGAGACMDPKFTVSGVEPNVEADPKKLVECADPEVAAGACCKPNNAVLDEGAGD